MVNPSPDGLLDYTRVLAASVRKMLLAKGGLELSRNPVLRQKEIVAFRRRIRVDALEKFNARTVFSVIKFYVDVAAMDADTPVGALIVFIEAEYVPRLLSHLEYPAVEEDDDAAILDGCGTLTNLIAGYFVKDLYDMGCVHLQMSYFDSYFNTAPNGVAFAPEQTMKYEISFVISGEKRLVAELTMGHVPKAN